MVRPPHPNRLGDISVLYVAAMGRALQARGIDPERLYRPFRITRELLQTPDARITIPRYMRLGHEAITLTGDPAIGLAFGQALRFTDMGLSGLTALCAPTLGDVLETLIRFERLTNYNSRGRSRWVAEGPGGPEAHFYSIAPYNRYNCFVVDTVLSGWLGLLDWLAPPNTKSAAVTRVELEYPPHGYAQALESFFQAPLHFDGDHNRLCLSKAFAHTPNPLAEPATWQAMQGRCEAELRRQELGWSVVDRVSEALTPRLRGQVPEMARIAAEIGTTEWGLRRRLAQQGLTYRGVVDRTRRELAMDYVRNTALSFSAISELLGFSHPAGFHRAFRRWHGEAPGEWRQRYSSTLSSTSSSSSQSGTSSRSSR